MDRGLPPYFWFWEVRVLPRDFFFFLSAQPCSEHCLCVPRSWAVGTGSGPPAARKLGKARPPGCHARTVELTGRDRAGESDREGCLPFDPQNLPGRRVLSERSLCLRSPVSSCSERCASCLTYIGCVFLEKREPQFAAWEDLPSLENRVCLCAGPSGELSTPLASQAGGRCTGKQGSRSGSLQSTSLGAVCGPSSARMWVWLLLQCPSAGA